MRRMYGLFTYMKGEKWLHSRGNVGKYSLHGAFGTYLVGKIKFKLLFHGPLAE